MNSFSTGTSAPRSMWACNIIVGTQIAPSPEETARKPKVPVLAHFGNNDHWIPLDTIEAFKKAHPEVEVHVYECGHGFNCDQRGSYDAAAAKLARERTLAFFAKHLG